jgi:hypothetical protein
MTGIETRSTNIEFVGTRFDTEAAGQETRDAILGSLDIPEDVCTEKSCVQRCAIEKDIGKTQVTTGGTRGRIADRYDLEYSVRRALQARIQGLAIAARDCQHQSWNY